TAGPHRSIIRPPCEPECVTPSADASEEVALGVFVKVSGSDFSYVSFIHIAFCNQSRIDQVPQPLGGIGVDFVIVGTHLHPQTFSIAFLPAILTASCDIIVSWASLAIARSVSCWY